MTEIINWIANNIGEICTLICSVIGVASVIVAITPSTKDNKILSVIIKVLDHISIAKTSDDKEVLERAKRQIR